MKSKNLFPIIMVILLAFITPIISSASSKSRPVVTVTSQDMEHNYYHNGAKGFKFNYNFNISQFQGKQLKLVLSVYKANGKRVYTSAGKPVQHVSYLNPGYDLTYYNNQWITVPYSMISTASVPQGTRIDMYVKLSFYNAATGAAIKTFGNDKFTFWLSR